MSMRTRYLATTLALLAIGLGFGLSQWHAVPAAPRPPARSAPPPKLVLPPTAREILDRGAVLKLAPRQTARLEELDRDWIAQSGALQAAIKDASSKLDRFMAQAKSGGGASMQEVQRQSADLRALSAELRERRIAHSARAVEILTGAQRQTLRGHSSDSPGGGA